MALKDQSAVPSTWKSVGGCKRSFRRFVTSRTTARVAGKGAGKNGQTTTNRTANCITTPMASDSNQKNDASGRRNNSVKWALPKPKVLIVPLLAILYVLSLHGLFARKDVHHSRSLVERTTVPFVYMPQVATAPPPTNGCIPLVIDAFVNSSNKKSENDKKSKKDNKKATNEKKSVKEIWWRLAKKTKECAKATTHSELKKDPNEPRVLLVSHNLHSPVGVNCPPDPCNPHDPHAPVSSCDPSNTHHPHDPVNPQDPHNPVSPQDPHNPVSPQDPHNPVSPQDPHNPVNPQDPHNPVSPQETCDPVEPQDPYDPQDPQDPYDPQDPQDPYDPVDAHNPYDPDDPRDAQDPYDPYDSDDPPYAHYLKDPEKQYGIYGSKKKPSTIIDSTSCETRTPEENIEFFFYSTSTYVYYTEEMKKRIFANGPVLTKKYMAEIFFELCEEQKENFLFMKETMSKISFMLASQFKLPNEERSKCWTHLNNKLNKVMNEFDLRDREDFNHFLMQKKRHSVEDFERFIENRICLWNKITRENRYESFLELYKNLNKGSFRKKFPYNIKNYRPPQADDCYAASNPDMPQEPPCASIPATPHNTLNAGNSPLQQCSNGSVNANVGSGPKPNGAFRSSSPTVQGRNLGTPTTAMPNSNICTTNPAIPQANVSTVNRPIPCNTVNANSTPMSNNTITASNAPAPCSTNISSIPVMPQSPYNTLNANVTTALPANTLNANVTTALPANTLNANVTTALPANTLNVNPATIPPYTTNAAVTGVPYTSLNPNVATIPQGTYNPTVAAIPQGAYSPGVATIPQGTYNPVIATVPQGTYSPAVATIPQGTYNPIIATVPQGTYSPVIATIPQGTYSPTIAAIPQGTYNPITKQVTFTVESGKESPKRKKKKK
ncbi:Uncharacterized protein PCOAH_00003860 [Plasmodium coatneyi]|uniref:Plasmodium RESA N-terminal domain-containing protein n=1 Tax=Plasmodium coatneyi TaxID=208452 RepID=A0A1B1DTM2_9APIC|nr:Uncharacterized protein PCOAH_00003860 [Plasmodium coatneyi]ANQ05935.1 Uncharacterized protein PCOAH_00003860 [Plasmodium coatneyi]